MAAPHRGSPMADSFIGFMGNSLTRLDRMLAYGFGRLARENLKLMTPGKSGGWDDESTGTLANAGDDIPALPSYRTPFALVEKLWRFRIHAQAGNIGGGEGRKRHRRDIRRGECNCACESIARFALATPGERSGENLNGLLVGHREGQGGGFHLQDRQPRPSKTIARRATSPVAKISGPKSPHGSGERSARRADQTLPIARPIR
jgi:hypothetical protein